ncbi:DUF6957 family protein [Pseudomonas syringae]|uniref:DUF6957 family protein n=1 Tax=Pseudomonas syringae TaxID=317 RepID=UPI0030DA092F
MDSKHVADLFDGATRLEGNPLSAAEAREAVASRFPGKPYCIVEEWTILRIDLTPDEIARVHSTNQLPLFIFAHKVVEDSQGRFQPGDWVRSSMGVTFEGGVLFETKNTAYVLIGPGHEKTASLKAIFSIF